LAGDLNNDGAVNFGDLTPFAIALTDPSRYDSMFPELAETRIARCDTNMDGTCNFADLASFVQRVSGRTSSGSGNYTSASRGFTNNGSADQRLDPIARDELFAQIGLIKRFESLGE
jgi:hypothetical protein